jgi:hypothetical protein
MNQDELSFKIEKSINDKIGILESTYRVRIDFEEIYGLYCNISKHNKELIEINIFTESIRLEECKIKLFEDFVLNLLEDELKELIKNGKLRAINETH